MNTKNPIEMAKEMAKLKEEHKTNSKVAALMDTSEATISRYIKLLELPADIQAKVAKGELPVTQPLRAHKRRTGERKPKVSALSPQHQIIIETLGRVQFATQAQLAQYAKRSLPALRPAIQDLEQTRFLEAHKELRPYVYRLSSHGCAIAGVNKPRHWMSHHAIHQRALRNEVELAMQRKNPSARFVERVQCWKMGLFPSIGEHLLAFQHEGKRQYALVIIDDYLMASQRVENSLTRLHDKEKSYAAGSLVLSWQDQVQYTFVYTTDENQKKRHEQYIDSMQICEGMPIITRYLKPVWEVL